MKPFNELTRLGKLRRYRHLSAKALEYYDLQVKRLEFLTTETNTMFRIDTADGKKYVLRIYSDEETTLQDNLAEIFWLNALTRDTDLNVTEPVARQDGDFITLVNMPGIPGERRCVLFKWIPGRCLEDNLTTGNYFKLGQILAKLHEHSESLNPLPSTIQPKRWDRVFYYPDEPVVYHLAVYRQFFPAERIALLNEVIARADRLFQELFADEHGRILIHGDLHFWNVHVYRDKLYIIDFEDIMLGYPVQDVAVTLSYGRDRQDYDELRAAFEQGYTSLRPWPGDSDQIETLIAARTVMFINYVARIDPSPQEYIEHRCQRLSHFLEGYG
jgi:Ser/Thr protein kinase RdoA (MazF antagonist)